MEKSAVNIKNVSVHYGQTKALSDICLEVAAGEYLGIIGPNGGGKSTLLRAILGLLSPSEGKIEVFGRTAEKSRPQMSYVPQFAVMDKRFPISVGEVVLTGCLGRKIIPFHHSTAADRKLAAELLERVGLGDMAGKRVSELSGGQFQKMLIARALAKKPKLLLLDEPTASVDALSRRQIFDLLSELNAGMTIILVTHDLFAVSSQVRRLACLNHTLVYHGEPELTSCVVENLYGCPVDLIAHGVPHRVLDKHDGEGERHDSCNH